MTPGGWAAPTPSGEVVTGAIVCMMEDMDDDFYEVDEPLEKILKIVDRDPDGYTEAPAQTIVIDAAAFQGVSITGARIVNDNPVLDFSGVRISR